MPRPPGTPTPCHRCPKGRPDGRPHPEKELTPQGWAAYLHYLECRAVSQFPADPLVRRNAALIRAAEDAAEHGRASNMTQLLALIASKPGK